MAFQRGPSRRSGYPALAQWIARDPDYEGFIFRRFDRLSARNLLHLQSRLLEIEGAIDRLDKDGSLDTSLKRWDILDDNAKEPDAEQNDAQVARDKRRMALYLELEQTIARYQDAVIRQSQVAALARPRRRAFRAFFDFFTGGLRAASNSSPAAHSGGSAPNGQGPRSDVLTLALGDYRSPLLQGRGLDIVAYPKDMLSVSPPPAQDLLSRFLRDHWPVRGRAGADYEKGTRPEGDDEDTAYVPERQIAATVGFISTAAAMFLLIGAIVSLHVVKDPTNRLIMISCYTMTFAGSLAAMTSARRAEVFAATAAYAAVLVVFVSGDLGNGQVDEAKS